MPGQFNMHLYDMKNFLKVLLPIIKIQEYIKILEKHNNETSLVKIP